MSDETTVGREPLQIVELEQPVCIRDYGTAPCTAAIGTTGSRKCYNTRATCQDPANYSATKSILWRFAKPAAVLPRDLVGVDAAGPWAVDPINATHPIPSLASVSTSPTRINIGGGSRSASPLGRRAHVVIALKDHLWDDHAGDFYVAQRPTGVAGDVFTPIDRGTFWSKWLARNKYHVGLTVNVYEGYVGQALGSMQKRTYVLDRIDGPNNDAVTLTAKDPLRLADGRRAEFPSTSEIELVGAIADDVTTSGIEVLCDESELTTAYGNTGTTRYLRIGDEILQYTGYSSTGTDEWTLSGVTRGVLGSTADAHDAEAKCQRVGSYSALEVWSIVEDLLTAHTGVDASFIDSTAWGNEGSDFLAPFVLTATVATPTPVDTLLGELMEQCSFYIWWDEREQTIPLKAIRPPLADGIVQLNDEQHIVRDSVRLTEDPDQRVSRVFLYYKQRDPTKGLEETGNYSSLKVRVDGDAESDDEYGDVRIRAIFSRWLSTAAQAIHTVTRQGQRFRNATEMLEFVVDAKDRSISTADVLEVTTRAVVDDTGAAVPRLWQVISAEEIRAGELVRYDCQRFEFLGRFWIWASESAPDYSAASAAEKEANAYWSDENGSPGDNDFGYQWL